MRKIFLVLLILPLCAIGQSVTIIPGGQTLNGDTANSNQMDIYGKGLVIQHKTHPVNEDPYQNIITMSCVNGGNFITSNSGIILDPSGNSNYTPGLEYNCFLGISNNANFFSYYKLSFEEFDLGIGDTLFVNEFLDGEPFERKYHSGSNLYDIYSTNELNFRFKTNTDNSVGSGFKLKFQAYVAIIPSSPIESFKGGNGFVYDQTNNNLIIGRNYPFRNIYNGFGSISVGLFNKSDGLYSASFGKENNAKGYASFASGEYSIASGYASASFGEYNNSKGNSSFSAGYGNDVFGGTSVAMGYGNKVSGFRSFAFGTQNESIAGGSIAFGYYNKLKGFGAITIGNNLIAKIAGSIVMGAFNDSTDTNGQYINATDRIFQLGNGDSQTRENALTILRNGNVGVGVLIPIAKLEVNGGIKTTGLDVSGSLKALNVEIGNGTIASGLYSAALGNGTVAKAKSSFSIGEFNNSSDSPNPNTSVSTDRIFQVGNGIDASQKSNAITVLRNGNTGIGVLTPTSKLEVAGDIKSTELDFIGTNQKRPVFVDKDGILRMENTSDHYLSYNFTSVQAQNYEDQIIRGSGFAWFNTTTSPKTLYLPVNLPDGVKVTNVRMYLLDNSTSNLSFTFNKNTHITNTFTSIATAQSSTNTVGIFSINNNANETIDNANNSYYVNISSSGNWTGNTLQFHSLVITYQYQ
jgi:hypothetical protein